MNWTTYWWEIYGEDSDLCGEEFLTALPNNATYEEHEKYAMELFPNEWLNCLGYVTEEDAEMMGLDTY